MDEGIWKDVPVRHIVFFLSFSRDPDVNSAQARMSSSAGFDDDAR